METVPTHSWKFFLFEGILFVILGLIAITTPLIFTFGIELLVGALLLVGGLTQIYRAFKNLHQAGFYSTLIAGIVSVIVGILMLTYPLAGAISLTLLLATYFFVDGITKLIVSLEWRRSLHWGWILVSGLLSLLLGGLIISGFPGTATWVIGLLVGINMLFFGWSLIFFSMAMPKREIK